MALFHLDLANQCSLEGRLVEGSSYWWFFVYQSFCIITLVQNIISEKKFCVTDLMFKFIPFNKKYQTDHRLLTPINIKSTNFDSLENLGLFFEILIPSNFWSSAKNSRIPRYFGHRPKIRGRPNFRGRVQKFEALLKIPGAGNSKILRRNSPGIVFIPRVPF